MDRTAPSLTEPNRTARPRPSGGHRAAAHRAVDAALVPPWLRLLVVVLVVVTVAGLIARATDPHYHVALAEGTGVAPSPSVPGPTDALPATDTTDTANTTDTTVSGGGTRAAQPTAAAARTGPALTGPGVNPGEQPPPADPLMRSQTAAGAMAAAVYFVRAVDWSIATNDPYLIEQIAAPGCRACAAYAAQVTAVRSAGATLIGGRWSIKNVARAQGASTIRADYVFRFTLDETAATVHVPGGSSDHLPAASGVVSFVFVSWQDGRWRVVEQTI